MAKGVFTIRDSYKNYPYKTPVVTSNGQSSHYYVKKSDMQDHPLAVNCTTYTTILEVYAKYLLSYILEGGSFFIPHSIGKLAIVKTMPKKERRQMDYQHWKKTGEVRFLENEHTNGFMVEFKWFRNKLRHIYDFTPTRSVARYLSKLLKEDTQVINKYDYVRK